MPAVSAPKLAGAPRVSESVAGTVPLTEPGVHSERFATSPLSTTTWLVESRVPFAAVQMIVQFSRRKPREGANGGPGTSCVAWNAGVGRTDGVTSIVNAPPAGATIQDSRGGGGGGGGGAGG